MEAQQNNGIFYEPIDEATPDLIREQVRRGMELAQLNVSPNHSHQFDKDIKAQADLLLPVLNSVQGYASASGKSVQSTELSKHIISLTTATKQIQRGTTLDSSKQVKFVYDYWKAIENTSILIGRVIGSDLEVATQPELNGKKNAMLEIFAVLNEAYQNIGQHMVDKGHSQFSNQTKESVMWIPHYGYLNTALVSAAVFGLTLFAKHIQHTHPKDMVKSYITIDKDSKTPSKATVYIADKELECTVDKTETGEVYYTLGKAVKLFSFEDVKGRAGIVEVKTAQAVNNGDKFKKTVDGEGEKFSKVDEVLHVNKLKESGTVKVESEFATERATGTSAQKQIPGRFRRYHAVQHGDQTILTHSKNGYDDYRGGRAVLEFISFMGLGLATIASGIQGSKTKKPSQHIDTNFDHLEAELRKRKDSLKNHLPARA